MKLNRHISTSSYESHQRISATKLQNPSKTNKRPISPIPPSLRPHDENNPPGPSPPHEKLTNFGSLGLPSLPTPCLSSILSIYTLLASSKPIGRLNQPPRMICMISFFAASSRPARESFEERLAERSKVEEVRPASASAAKEGMGM